MLERADAIPPPHSEAAPAPPAPQRARAPQRAPSPLPPVFSQHPPHRPGPRNFIRYSCRTPTSLPPLAGAPMPAAAPVPSTPSQPTGVRVTYWFPRASGSTPQEDSPWFSNSVSYLPSKSGAPPAHRPTGLLKSKPPLSKLSDRAALQHCRAEHAAGLRHLAFVFSPLTGPNALPTPFSTPPCRFHPQHATAPLPYDSAPP